MYIVMVLSGKGGVGKSLVSCNLAYSLAKAGKKVALYDMDLSNPNLAEMLGIKDEIHLSKEETPEFYPIIHDDIEFFSMANICGDKPVSMEGAMYGQILRDVLSQQKNWKAEIGICDMSAGVADTFLEIVNVFGENLLGSIIVFVPAHVDSARRLLKLHQNEGVPVLGIIENMSHFRCPKCDETYEIFGGDMLKTLAEEFKVNPLGSIPMSMVVRKAVLDHKPFLPPPLDEPINNAVKQVLEAKPVGLSLVQKIKEKLKQEIRDVVTDIIAAMVETANEEIDLKALRDRYHLAEGRILELDITDETLRKVKTQIFLKLKDGVWYVIKNPKGSAHDEVRVWDRAFLWAMLGRRTDTNTSFDILDCWTSGKAKYYGTDGATQRVLRFIRDVWQEVRNTKAFAKFIPILERVA
jgi:ATP-binding protein involved in chromosome partitioning